jgi:hypothetical protein
VNITERSMSVESKMRRNYSCPEGHPSHQVAKVQCEPTGRLVLLPARELIEVRDGKIAHANLALDVNRLVRRD